MFPIDCGTNSVRLTSLCQASLNLHITLPQLLSILKWTENRNSQCLLLDSNACNRSRNNSLGDDPRRLASMIVNSRFMMCGLQRLKEIRFTSTVGAWEFRSCLSLRAFDWWDSIGKSRIEKYPQHCGRSTSGTLMEAAGYAWVRDTWAVRAKCMPRKGVRPS